MPDSHSARAASQSGSPLTLERAKDFIRVEASALSILAENLTGELCTAARTILSIDGKVVVSGVGKSQLVGEKISATLASTGTPSFTLDPTNALHGDLGRVSRGDAMLALSNSGETAELSRVVDIAKALPIMIIAITGDAESSLARQSDIVLDIGRTKEACPLGLAPTTSTTTMMALGDALALIILEQRGFTRDDFARLHPAGSLGKTAASLRYSGC